MSNRSLGLSFCSVDEVFTLLETLEKTTKNLNTPESRAAYVRDVAQAIIYVLSCFQNFLIKLQSDCTNILCHVQCIAARIKDNATTSLKSQAWVHLIALSNSLKVSSSF